jgi:hypothetical protein
MSRAGWGGFGGFRIKQAVEEAALSLFYNNPFFFFSFSSRTSLVEKPIWIFFSFSFNMPFFYNFFMLFSDFFGGVLF